MTGPLHLPIGTSLLSHSSFSSSDGSLSEDEASSFFPLQTKGAQRFQTAQAVTSSSNNYPVTLRSTSFNNRQMADVQFDRHEYHPHTHRETSPKRDSVDRGVVNRSRSKCLAATRKSDFVNCKIAERHKTPEIIAETYDPAVSTRTTMKGTIRRPPLPAGMTFDHSSSTTTTATSAPNNMSTSHITPSIASDHVAVAQMRRLAREQQSKAQTAAHIRQKRRGKLSTTSVDQSAPRSGLASRGQQSNIANSNASYAHAYPSKLPQQDASTRMVSAESSEAAPSLYEVGIQATTAPISYARRGDLGMTSNICTTTIQAARNVTRKPHNWLPTNTLSHTVPHPDTAYRFPHRSPAGHQLAITENHTPNTAGLLNYSRVVNSSVNMSVMPSSIMPIASTAAAVTASSVSDQRRPHQSRHFNTELSFAEQHLSVTQHNPIVSKGTDSKYGRVVRYNFPQQSHPNMVAVTGPADHSTYAVEVTPYNDVPATSTARTHPLNVGNHSFVTQMPIMTQTERYRRPSIRIDSTTPFDSTTGVFRGRRQYNYPHRRNLLHTPMTTDVSEGKLLTAAAPQAFRGGGANFQWLHNEGRSTLVPLPAAPPLPAALPPPTDNIRSGRPNHIPVEGSLFFWDSKVANDIPGGFREAWYTDASKDVGDSKSAPNTRNGRSALTGFDQTRALNRSTSRHVDKIRRQRSELLPKLVKKEFKPPWEEWECQRQRRVRARLRGEDPPQSLVSQGWELLVKAFQADGSTWKRRTKKAKDGGGVCALIDDEYEAEDDKTNQQTSAVVLTIER
eukprot:Lankesteria_metandrocarpae@DN166_c0_g1_i1.p1